LAKVSVSKKGVLKISIPDREEQKSLLQALAEWHLFDTLRFDSRVPDDRTVHYANEDLRDKVQKVLGVKIEC
jgi:hypothetical protein